MALTPDQECEWTAQLESMGVPLVRSELERGKIQPHWIQLTAAWLSSKDKDAEARKEASNAEQIELARRASEAADRAASAAERAASAAELQTTKAGQANRRATIALVVATISIIATAIGTAISIWIAHMDAHK